jgi:hypothetical protein
MTFYISKPGKDACIKFKSVIQIFTQELHKKESPVKSSKTSINMNPVGFWA